MKKLVTMALFASIFVACDKKAQTGEFDYNVDRFADVQVLRYAVPGFEELPLQQKELVYYLTEAAIAGRDIFWDQNCKWNLAVRRTVEAVYTNYAGDKNAEEYKALEEYMKLIWFNNGIHHDYSSEKLQPAFSARFFEEQVKALDASLVPTKTGQSVEAFIAEITPVMFDPAVMAIRANQADGADLLLTSANNYYDGVTQAEAEAFYAKMKDPKDQTPVSYGLNSRLVKENGKVVEKVWKVGGLYTQALEKVVYWLEKALTVAETDAQKEALTKLIAFNKDGNLKTFDDYAVAWVQDVNSVVDAVVGFTETYGDPLGMRASWEAVINFKNVEATKRTTIISENAQWFEDNSPVDKQYKKDEVKGVSAKVITVAMLGGDCHPTTPIGINLPNSNWIRKDYGSKSVTIENITEAYDRAATGNGFNEEFVWSDTERKLLKEYGFQVDNMHTDLHECLGHGSGKLLPGVDADALKAYGAPLEETRADLFALYYVADPKMVELGLLPNNEAYKAEYYRYIMNGLMTQLTRIKPGKSIEQAHMRNRSTIAHWALEKGAADKVVELIKRDGKTFVKINDYEKLRTLFGQLLAEVQTIKSTGDFDGAKQLIETYGVKVNQELHQEVLARYETLNIAPWRGFINPVYSATTDANGKITDVTISYTENYVEQMLRYGKEYSFLPTYSN